MYFLIYTQVGRICVLKYVLDMNVFSVLEELVYSEVWGTSRLLVCEILKQVVLKSVLLHKQIM